MWEKLKNLREWAVEQCLWAERTLTELSGPEKREAVIRRLDDMIQLPAYLEWLDDILIAQVVDAAVAGLNAALGHKFGAAEITQEQEAEIAEGIKTEGV